MFFLRTSEYCNFFAGGAGRFFTRRLHGPIGALELELQLEESLSLDVVSQSSESGHSLEYSGSIKYPH